MPSPVDKYFKEVKQDNPSYSDEQAWATAWSIYCKHKNPDSEHCHKDSDEYLKGKSAGVVVRVAGRFKEALTLSPEIEQAAKAARNVGELLQQMIDTAHAGGDADYATPIAAQLSRILGMYKHNVTVMTKAIDTIPKGKEQQRAKALVKELEKVFSKSFEYKWEGARWLSPGTTEKALKKLVPLVDELEMLLVGQKVLFKSASITERVAMRFTQAAKGRTFDQARTEIFDLLKQKHWRVVDGLKIPHATSPSGELRLWFKKQAVYSTVSTGGFRGQQKHDFKDARSTWIEDIRKLTAEQFLQSIERMFHGEAIL